MTWLTTAQAEALWADAAHLDPEVLDLLLASAYDDCIAFLPDGSADVLLADVPKSWLLAQAYQARARYNAILAGGDNQAGSDDQTVTIWPLDFHIKQLLRPKHGKPSIA